MPRIGQESVAPSPAVPLTPHPSSSASSTDAPPRSHVAVARSVDVRIGRTRVLAGLDFTVAPGEVVGVTGPNGSGKSTLLRVLATLRRPAAGSLEILGRSWPHVSTPEVRRRIVLVGHDPGLHPDLTLAENLELVAALSGESSSSARCALADVGLAAAADRPAGACSEGMRRRSGLARALLCRPQLLLLDEPHASLDVASRPLVAGIADRVTARGGAVVVVTHDVEGANGHLDRVLTLQGGRLTAEARG
ncbi:MAG: heme ABC exporter ATP-binding protein CcmA [Actinobacteria bacterium]|nr:heme ABC exporter ATP-binding protein CcmA [Actinomycetota bacterium]